MVQISVQRNAVRVCTIYVQLALCSRQIVNDTWLKMRKAANRMLSPANSDNIKQIQLAEASQLMLEMLRKPQVISRVFEHFYNSLKD
jgi:BarA-like signal transduction histidine kinase